ncbi:Aminodeoxychorismate/anthranilate synthase component 2 [Sporotomaculum syntrophicum]|uniref:Aminodeoxychorismate/anthranilate synthase component 2 n=1 Tax=Sporotomaculum syntrophicum TaxID=182264 RepID=A0A9D2WP55_9FIRM|nr:aminodeoxychorismate/anthranilate synthase component II [Sporotomaculum syntrophicum]KAF1084366.1 Aminodeoxychorismate/anthranilate synthase component 2 [Sporotomaculum syntrophicum]
MILLIDNYDSFAYNLVQLAGSINPDIQVVRNDELTVPEIEALQPSHIILSPGPGYPHDAGICEDVVYRLAGKVPILGVCLGHQAICEVYGAEITHAKRLMHGKQCTVTLDNECPLFQGLPGRIEAARYHSLAARNDTLPAQLQVIAIDELGEVMAVRHNKYQVYGVQFHPESIMTPQGQVVIKNFLNF